MGDPAPGVPDSQLTTKQKLHLELALCQQALQSRKNEIDRLKYKREDDKEDYREKIEKLKDEIKKLKKEKDRYKDTVKDLEDENEDLKKEIRRLR